MGRGQKSEKTKSSAETGETGCGTGQSKTAIIVSTNPVPRIEGSNESSVQEQPFLNLKTQLRSTLCNFVYQSCDR